MATTIVAVAGQSEQELDLDLMSVCGPLTTDPGRPNLVSATALGWMNDIFAVRDSRMAMGWPTLVERKHLPQLPVDRSGRHEAPQTPHELCLRANRPAQPIRQFDGPRDFVSHSTRLGRRPKGGCQGLRDPRALFCVGIQASRRGHAARVERRTSEGRLDEHHPNTKLPHLVIEGFREALERVLRARVDCSVRSRYESLHRAHVDNESRAPCAHVRQHGLARPNDTEYIGVEKRLRLLDRGLLECAEYAETRIVDEHIDAPCGIDHGLHRPPDGVSDGDVERQETDARTGGRLLRR